MNSESASALTVAAHSAALLTLGRRLGAAYLKSIESVVAPHEYAYLRMTWALQHSTREIARQAAELVITGDDYTYIPIAEMLIKSVDSKGQLEDRSTADERAQYRANLEEFAPVFMRNLRLMKAGKEGGLALLQEWKEELREDEYYYHLLTWTRHHGDHAMLKPVAKKLMESDHRMFRSYGESALRRIRWDEIHAS